ncbi:outer membrane protein assembly factor BamA [Neptunitalea lumnitzerae]|uniref:Outer membrane protein assembly factor BamA n=1 Tax=Neptunitalea lumnitzerae TaxID=2965509 RepID=A0ABQ5MML7_9FLAO|nr:outer membrane protein assembly factor BamA [Neptunitalea sp. Y10]GLB50650.1 outer membrane protein assembly factor BamA [Neptunitalea sp. Y10]
MQPKLTKILFALCVLFISSYSVAQEENDIIKNGKVYTLGGIDVTGLKSFNKQTVVTTTGLRIGQEISFPSTEISDVIKKLIGYDLFSDVKVYAATEGDQVFLTIDLKELPALSDFKIVGIKDRKKEDIIKDTELKKGKKVTESFLVNTKNYLVKKYKDDGFNNAKVTITTRVDTTEANAVKMLINIDKGDKVKVKDIQIVGNEKLSDKKIKKAMKNTKERFFLRFWKKSKFIPENYEEDLANIISKYAEKGYRDARIISDSIIHNEDNSLSLKINVQEGEKYYFGDIDFVGNNVYSDETLRKVLGIKKGDTYNGVLLKKRIADATDPDADDITNLYQNSGYLFSNVNAVEISAKNDTIDFEIRIIEGKPAYFNHVTVVGNDRTNDHVIYRELRTRPGELYQKTNIIRTIRELSQLGFFDPETIKPNIKNPDANAGTVDVEYYLEEKGSSQVQLQGGYGGGGFIGTLGLSFNNFSLRNIFNKKAYRPLPMGDGQSLALRLQASRFYQTYSFSFAEPWLGGKEPKQFSVSFNHTIQYATSYNNGYYTGNVDRSRRFLISGVSVGLAKRLKVPDDYFYFSQALSFQHYNLKNYTTSLFTFGDGFSNSLAYTVGLSRKSSGPNPIFPTTGSDFSVSAKVTFPYSLVDGTDWDALKEERDELIESGDDADRISEIDQQRFEWLEFYKVKFSGNWYTTLPKKFVLKTGAEFGFLGSYNSSRGLVPFERFFVGGDGMANYTLDGRENIQLRGYPNQSLSSADGSVIYNKFSLELRYPITLGNSASIYGLTFLEGGAAFDEFRDYNPFQLKRSAGVGLRIFMPAFGLLGIDFGYGFDAIDGTNQANGWETHFVIGQQF